MRPSLSSVSSDSSLSTSLSVSSSSTSTNSTLFSRLVRKPSCDEISVTVENRQLYYAPGDCLTGNVTISPVRDTGFSGVFVSLEGVAKTQTDRTTGRTTVTNTFLKMSDAVCADDFPSPRIFRAGQSYSYKFSFVLPEYLLDTECHDVGSHRQLPSSMGDAIPNDCAPDMACITYKLVARVLRVKENGQRNGIAFNAETSITVVAAYMPDLSAMPHNQYRGQEVSVIDEFTRFYRTSKAVQRGLLSRATTASDNIGLEGSILHPFIYRQHNPVPLVLSLSYVAGDSKKELVLPTIDSIKVILRVYTYFTSERLTYNPTPKSRQLDSRLGIYSESFAIAERSCRQSDAHWARESQAHYSYNTAIELEMPKSKVLVPNFWSCLIGRQYEAEITVKLSGTSNSKISLRVPVEVTTEKVADEVLRRSLLRDAMLETETSAMPDDNDDDPVLDTVSDWASAARTDLANRTQPGSASRSSHDRNTQPHWLGSQQTRKCGLKVLEVQCCNSPGGHNGLLPRAALAG